MATIDRDLFLARMKELGHSMKSLSKAAGLGETAARDILKRNENPTRRTIEEFSRVLGVSVAELLGSDGPAPKVPIIGHVSAGEGWIPADHDNYETVELGLEGDAIALHVRGDSMAPAYRDGDLIIGVKRTQRRAENLIGVDSIVETTDHRRYVKFLAKGSQRGLFNLRSYNPAHKDIEDVAILWAAPVAWIRRGGR